MPPPAAQTVKQRGMVIAAVVGWRQLALAVIGAAELAAPENQRVVEHASLLQILDQVPRRPGRSRGTVTRMPAGRPPWWSQPG